MHEFKVISIFPFERLSITGFTYYFGLLIYVAKGLFTFHTLHHHHHHLFCSTNAIYHETSGYATWFTAGGAIRMAHYDVIDDVVIRKL